MSIGLAIALIGLTSVALAFLLVPLLLRRRADASREAYNLRARRANSIGVNGISIAAPPWRLEQAQTF